MEATQELVRTSTHGPEDRYSAVRQYSLAQVIGVWAAAAVPMGVLAWIVTPLLSHHLSGPEPLGRALMVCLTV